MKKEMQAAINHLSIAKNVSMWNDLRDSLKSILTTDQITEIDGSGLIVKVLGEDKHKSYSE